MFGLANGTTVKDKPLTDLMMTMWTNFAKSGWVANCFLLFDSQQLHFNKLPGAGVSNL